MQCMLQAFATPFFPNIIGNSLGLQLMQDIATIELVLRNH